MLTKTTASLAFGSVRVRTQSPEQVVTITNTGTAPLGITQAQLDPATSESSNYVILADTCSTGATVPAGGTCTLRVAFAPLTTGPHPTQLLLTSNAASSPDFDPGDRHRHRRRGRGRPDQRGQRLPGVVPGRERDHDRAVHRPEGPDCIVPPSEFFDGVNPSSFPNNFPGEFFYSSRRRTTSTHAGLQRQRRRPGVRCAPPSRARSSTADPRAGRPDGFGRIRIAFSGGLCPGSTYKFVPRTARRS